MSEEKAEDNTIIDDSEAQIESENTQDNASQKSSFADGFGMSIEEVKALLAKKHETIVPKDDPILLIVTILNVFLESHEKLSEKLNKKQLDSMNELLTMRTEGYIKGVKDTVDGLSQTLESITVEGITNVQEKHNQHMHSFKYNMWCATAIITLSAILNVTVFVLR